MNKNCYKYFIISALFTAPVLAQESIVVINKSAEIDRVLALKKEINEAKSFICLLYTSPSPRDRG